MTLHRNHTACLALVAGAVIVSSAFSGFAAPQEKSPEKKKSVTTITSQMLTYDYSNSLAIFEKDVVVIDPQMRMDADLMKIRFAGTNQVKSVEATGNVRFKKDMTGGKCRYAKYTAATGEIELIGNAELTRGVDIIVADKITFFILDDEVQSVKARGHVKMRHVEEGNAKPIFRSPVPAMKRQP